MNTPVKPDLLVFFSKSRLVVFINMFLYIQKRVLREYDNQGGGGGFFSSDSDTGNPFDSGSDSDSDSDTAVEFKYRFGAEL